MPRSLYVGEIDIYLALIFAELATFIKSYLFDISHALKLDLLELFQRLPPRDKYKMWLHALIRIQGVLRGEHRVRKTSRVKTTVIIWMKLPLWKL